MSDEETERPVQYYRDQLKTMTPEEVNEAREAGHLDDLMSGSPARDQSQFNYTDRPTQLTREQVQRMTADDIAAAMADGACDDLLAGRSVANDD